MLCQACHRPDSASLCSICRAGLRPAAERVLEGGTRLVAAYEHVGPARSLVLDLKYRGLTMYADLVVEAIVGRVPRLPVVPIPRAWSRRLRYGVDPAGELAGRLAQALGTPVWNLLSPPIHVPRRAGGDHSRAATVFGGRPAPGRYVLVDDVVTTGATVSSAATSLGFSRLALVVAANVADRCLVH